MANKKDSDDLVFVKYNIHSLYEWACSMDDQIKKLKDSILEMNKKIK